MASFSLNLNESHLSALFCYVSKFCYTSTSTSAHADSLSLDAVINSLHAFPKYELLPKFSQLLANHTSHFRKFFMVPNNASAAADSLRRSELLAGFINFLLQMLDSDIPTPESEDNNQIAALQRALKSLIALLGDFPLMHCGSVEFTNLMDRFQLVANGAGDFIFSMFLDYGSSSYPTPASSMNVEGLSDLFKEIELLNHDIKEHIIKFPELPTCVAPNTAVDLFIVDSFINDLNDLIKGGDSLGDDLKKGFVVLHKELNHLRSLVKEIMDVPHPTEIEEFKEPVRQIRDLAYEAEYCINSFTVGDVPEWYINIRLPGILHKVKLVRIRLEELKKSSDAGQLQIAEEFALSISFKDEKKPLMEHVVVGFDDAAREILEELRGGGMRKTVLIYGMPGLGKTTLAQKVYDDPLTTRHFDKCAWCIVSQTYRRRNLLIEILTCLLSQDLDKEKIAGMEDDELAKQIYQTFMGRRYLVVMDDIWSTLVWDDFNRYFPDEVNGSRVLFTSRNKEVAPRGSSFYQPPFLSHDQCWQLLQLKAFRQKVLDQESCPLDLRDVGNNIARLCDKLPLAIVITGGILANLDRKEMAWRKVEKSLASYIRGDQSNIMKILELSYKHLPDYLKPCFLYFGAFPEDLEIPTWKLFSLWVAEGFIQNEETRSKEWMADKYLLDLIDRSLVSISRIGFSGVVKACRIHDLLREMCLGRADDDNFLKLIQGRLSVHEKHHRLCGYPLGPTWSRPFGLHVRAYLGILSDLFFCFPGMKLLKILDLLDRMLEHNEQERIGLLVHLRYLSVGLIPSSIASCGKLEFLYVESNTVVVIPPALLKMMKLRYLHIETQARFDEDCCLSESNNLHTLSRVQLYKLEDEEILKYCPHLRKLKCLCEPLLDNRLPSAHRCPDLAFLKHLESLKLEFGSSFRGEYAIIVFPKSLRKLSLSNIGLPWKKMSIIGRLPNLEVLKLVSNAFEGQRWQTRNGEFQKLKFLKLDRLKFSRWIVAACEHFPRLEKLAMYKCYHLLKVPSEIGDVDTLKIIEAHSCGVYVRNSVAKIKQEQMQQCGNDDLKVIITGDVW